jgi:hypothetical protein
MRSIYLQYIHHILIEPVCVSDLCGDVLDIPLKVIHIGVGIDKRNVTLEIDQTLSFRYILNPHIEVIKRIFKDVFSAFFDITRIRLNLFLFSVIAVKSSLQILVELVDIFCLICVLMFYLIFDLKFNFFMRLFHPVLFSLFMIQFLFSFDQIQSIFFADIPIF